MVTWILGFARGGELVDHDGKAMHGALCGLVHPCHQVRPVAPDIPRGELNGPGSMRYR